jgi:hypothetical protein
MKTITDKKVYQCEFCGKLSLGKGGMVVHEMNCKKNPKNWTDCASCEYLKVESRKIEDSEGKRCKRCKYYDVDYNNYGYAECTKDDGNCDGSLYITDFICEKTGKKMYYEKKVRMMRKEKREEIIKRCDCAMPNECEILKKEREQEDKLFDEFDKML